MNSECFTVRIPEGETIRLDRFIASLGLFTRSQISRRSVRARSIHGDELKFSRRLQDGDEIVVDWDDPPESDILPESMELDILYEDENCIVINKAQGVVVHPALGHVHGTLVQGLLHRYEGFEDSFGGGRVRPGIVHRLDKDTSGLIVVAKNPAAMDFLAKEFRDRTVKKTYLAVTRGSPPETEGEIRSPIGRDPRDRKKFQVDTRNAKDALTRYRVLSQSGTHAVVQVRILTGRTHQIRVHLKSMNTPILGDAIYGQNDSRMPGASLMLHAWKLSIRLPSGEKRRFEAKIPPRFQTAAAALGLNLNLPR